MANSRYKYKVSVLVTFYNQQDVVNRALDSIASQKFDYPIQILIGDDGSNDGTKRTIENWIESHDITANVFTWPRDQGVQYEPIVRASNNRLSLLSKVQSEYIVFLDGDDYFSSDLKLAKQVEILDSDLTLGCCAHNVDYVDTNGRLIKQGVKSINEGLISFNDYWACMSTPAMAFMFRNTSSLINDNLYIDSKNFDDNSIVFSLWRSGEMYYLPISMVAYVQESESSWHLRKESDRQLVNLNDYLYEIEIRPEAESAIKARHITSFIWLLKNKNAELKGLIKSNHQGSLTYINILREELINPKMGQNEKRFSNNIFNKRYVFVELIKSGCIRLSSLFHLRFRR